MNNLLLVQEDIKTTVESAIKSFFEINDGTAYPVFVWETFKVYKRGILISIHSYNNRDNN